MKTIFRIIANAKEWRFHLVVATLSMMLAAAANVAIPIIIRQLFNVVESNATVSDTVLVSLVLLALLALFMYLLRAFFQFLNHYLAHIAAWRMVAKMRGKVYAHLQTLSMSYYGDKQTGQLMSRVIEDTATFEVLIAHALPELLSCLFIFGGVAVALILINPLLALLTCAPLPLILFCSFFMRRMHRHFRKRQEVSAELSAMLQDNLSGIKEIQIFNKQEHESGSVYKKAQEHAAFTIKGIFWVSLMHPVMNFLSGFGTLIVIFFGGIFAIVGTSLSIADITVFLLYLGIFYAPIAMLARVFEDIQNAVVSGNRVFEVLDTESKVKDLPSARDVEILKGNVEFENVSFDYVEDIEILKNISFSVLEGKMTALVGSTGAGKTTITSLLARFYDVSEGRITIDGIDIRDMTLASLRNQMSIVMQDVFLFNGTIAQNIAYGKDGDATMDEIMTAAKTAAVHDFIDGLPEKYETKIGERGMRLSGGQKQRIAIARALLRKSPILILDEATSAVDNETETEIQSAINHIAGLRTVIVIAHRLSTVEKADSILVLDNGEIVERGTHTELLDKNGIYAKMVKSKNSLS